MAAEVLEARQDGCARHSCLDAAGLIGWTWCASGVAEMLLGGGGDDLHGLRGCQSRSLT